MKSKSRQKWSAIWAAPAPTRRPSIIIRIRCDLISSSERWPVTLSFSSPPESLWIGLLRLTPQSARGKVECAKFGRGDYLHFDFAGNIYRARIAWKSKVGGKILLHAFDLLTALVPRVFLKTTHALAAAKPRKVARRD